jgi:hypothetical protein
LSLRSHPVWTLQRRGGSVEIRFRWGCRGNNGARGIDA